jgi:acetyl-CoA acyltransferase
VAQASGHFVNEIVPVEVKVRDPENGDVLVTGDLMTADSGIRETSMGRLAALSPVFRPNGLLTAGNSSQISDGAAAVLIMSERRATDLGVSPMARIVGFGRAGVDPIEMLTAPIPATRHAIGRSGLHLADIAAFEVNEAFAPVVLAWQESLDVDPEIVNSMGGAIALGHPLGASGARLMTTLVHRLNKSGGYGLQTMCEGGGTSTATIIERAQ